MVRKPRSYLIVRFVVVVFAAGVILILVIILIIEIGIVEIVIDFLEMKSVAGEPVNGTGNELFFNVFAELIVQLEAFLDVGCDGFIVLTLRRLWWVEEVKEGVGWDGLLENAGLLGSCESCQCLNVMIAPEDLLLLRCFLLSTRTVRSFSGFQKILSPSAWS